MAYHHTHITVTTPTAQSTTMNSSYSSSTRWFSSSLLLLACFVSTSSLLSGRVGVAQAFVPLTVPSHQSYGSSSTIVSQPLKQTYPTAASTTRLHAGLTLEQIEVRLDTYEVSVQKPMGVIFGENSEPYLGLVVDDISEGMNGGKAGVRQGDQLISVNGKVVLGSDFDSIMEKMTDEGVGPVLDLVFYRGPVRQMYSILGNQLEDGQSIASDDDDDDEDDEDSEEVVMDENYESPVQIDVSKYEDKPLTAGDFVKAIGKLGSIVAETLTDDGNDDDSNEGPSSGGSGSEDKKEKKKKTGFFGIGGETIQLDGKDAKF